MLNTPRSLAHPGSRSLDDLRSINMLLDSVKKNTISRDQQTPGLVVFQVLLTLQKIWGVFDHWDEVMMAAIIDIGFQTTLRPIKITCL